MMAFALAGGAGRRRRLHARRGAASDDGAASLARDRRVRARRAAKRDRGRATGAGARSQARNGAINAFTAVTEDRALAEAAAVDAARAAGRDPGPLAGVPFAVKNLYDIAGLPTIAGSRIDRDRAPAARDAALVRRLIAAGRRAGRRAQHGRIRLRLLDRKHALRRDPQSARSLAHRRRLVRRIGGGGRRFAGAADARLRHQRLDPRARGAVRRFRAEADLSAGSAAPACGCSRRASTSAARSPARRRTSRSPMTRCRGPIRRIRSAPAAPPEPVLADAAAGRGRPAHRDRRRLFREPGRRPRRSPRSSASPRRSA